VFSSDRSGTLGGQDIYVAARDSTNDPWSAPVNLGGAINKETAETRPSLSCDAQTLYFGRRPGPSGCPTSTSRLEASSRGRTGERFLAEAGVGRVNAARLTLHLHQPRSEN